MNDPSPELANPEKYIDKLMGDFDDMEKVARDKLFEERSVHFDWPWETESDAPTDEPINNAREALRDLALYDLYGDYDALDKLKIALDVARVQLNGMNVPDSVPPRVEEKLPKGIDPEITAITTGLASWKNDTGDLFRANYVSTIGQRKANQVASIDTSKNALDSAQRILLDVRKAAMTFPGDVKEKLEGYHPFWSAGLDTMELALTGVGIVVGPIGSSAAVITQKLLPKKDGLTVAGIMNALVDGVTALRNEKNRADKRIADQLTKLADDEQKTWQSRVCSRPHP